jgi:hypothetical protein
LDTNDGGLISLYFYLHIADNSSHCLKYLLPESLKYARGTAQFWRKVMIVTP